MTSSADELFAEALHDLDPNHPGRSAGIDAEGNARPARRDLSHHEDGHGQVLLVDAVEAPVGAWPGVPQRRPHEPHGVLQLRGISQSEQRAVLAGERGRMEVLGGGGGAGRQESPGGTDLGGGGDGVGDLRGEPDLAEGVVDPCPCGPVMLRGGAGVVTSSWIREVSPDCSTTRR